jgi:hypothetical protein
MSRRVILFSFLADLSDRPTPVATYEPAALRRAGLAEEYILDLGTDRETDSDS